MNQEIINQLRDVHWPKAQGWWPLPIGYYLVALVLAIIVGLLAICLKRVWHKRKIRNEVLGELKAIESSFLQNGDGARLQFAIGGLLRRMLNMRSTSPDRKNSSLSIEDLASIFRDREAAMNILELLNQDRFKKDPQVDGRALVVLVKGQVIRWRI